MERIYPRPVLTNETIRKAIKLYFIDYRLAIRTYGFIEEWDTSEVTDMSNLIECACNDKYNDINDIVIKFNQDISAWDVGNVTDMNHMFYNAKNFLQNIGAWNTKNVTTVKHMLRNATRFCQDLCEWDVEKVEDLEHIW